MEFPIALYEKVVSDYTLDHSGLHGPAHWLRVYCNSIDIASMSGIDPEVPALFALLHDSQRVTEGTDIDHGPRAAEYAMYLRDEYFELDDRRFELLVKACKFHTLPITCENHVIQSCWDADRLDLGRCGLQLNAKLIGGHTWSSIELREKSYDRGLQKKDIDIKDLLLELE